MRTEARAATDDDFEFVKRCWGECFDDDARYVDWNFSRNYMYENTVIGEYDGIAAAAMQCIPYNWAYKKFRIPARYVSGVSVMPQYRGRGLARRLFEYGIPLMHKDGCVISFLISAVGNMYEKFGFKTVCDRVIYKTAALEGKPARTVNEISVEALDRIYRRQTRGKMHVERRRADWDRLSDELVNAIGGAAAIADNAYCFAFSDKNGEFEVYEKCGGFSFEPIRREPLMMRIIDAETFLKIFSARFPSGAVISISDSYIPCNNGRFRISNDSVSRCAEGDLSAADFDFTIDELCGFVLRGVPIYIGNIL